MSLNFDHNSNLSIVSRFHTGKIVKMCQFYSGNFHFFLQPTVRFIRMVHSQSTLQRLLRGEI
jgi:hypothetical protein